MWTGPGRTALVRVDAGQREWFADVHSQSLHLHQQLAINRWTSSAGWLAPAAAMPRQHQCLLRKWQLALPLNVPIPCHCCVLQLTIFKRVCRKLGLQRWPYEKPCKADGERTSGGARAGGTPRGTGSWHLPPVTQAWTGGARVGNHGAAPGGSRASSGQASGQELVAAAAQVGGLQQCCAAACVDVQGTEDKMHYAGLLPVRRLCP